MSTWRDYPVTAAVRLGPFASRVAAPAPPEREKGEGYVADWNADKRGGARASAGRPRQKRRPQ